MCENEFLPALSFFIPGGGLQEKEDEEGNFYDVFKASYPS